MDSSLRSLQVRKNGGVHSEEEKEDKTYVIRKKNIASTKTTRKRDAHTHKKIQGEERRGSGIRYIKIRSSDCFDKRRDGG